MVPGTSSPHPCGIPGAPRAEGAELSPPAQGGDEGYGTRHLLSPCWFARWLQGTEGALGTSRNCTQTLFSLACGLGLPLGKASSTGQGVNQNTEPGGAGQSPGLPLWVVLQGNPSTQGPQWWVSCSTCGSIAQRGWQDTGKFTHSQVGWGLPGTGQEAASILRAPGPAVGVV